jgi:hypothetical protein
MSPDAGPVRINCRSCGGPLPAPSPDAPWNCEYCGSLYYQPSKQSTPGRTKEQALEEIAQDLQKQYVAPAEEDAKEAIKRHALELAQGREDIAYHLALPLWEMRSAELNRASMSESGVSSCEEAIRLAQKSFGKASPLLIPLLEKLLHAYKLLGHSARPRRVATLKQLLPLKEQAKGREHREVDALLEQLFEATGDDPYAREMIARRERAFGALSVEVVSALRLYATRQYCNQDRQHLDKSLARRTELWERVLRIGEGTQSIETMRMALEGLRVLENEGTSGRLREIEAVLAGLAVHEAAARVGFGRSTAPKLAGRWLRLENGRLIVRLPGRGFRLWLVPNPVASTEAVLGWSLRLLGALLLLMAVASLCGKETDKAVAVAVCGGWAIACFIMGGKWVKGSHLLADGCLFLTIQGVVFSVMIYGLWALARGAVSGGPAPPGRGAETSHETPAGGRSTPAASAPGPHAALSPEATWETDDKSPDFSLRLPRGTSSAGEGRVSHVALPNGEKFTMWMGTSQECQSGTSQGVFRTGNGVSFRLEGSSYFLLSDGRCNWFSPAADGSIQSASLEAILQTLQLKRSTGPTAWLRGQWEGAFKGFDVLLDFYSSTPRGAGEEIGSVGYSRRDQSCQLRITLTEGSESRASLLQGSPVETAAAPPAGMGSPSVCLAGHVLRVEHVSDSTLSVTWYEASGQSFGTTQVKVHLPD